MTAAGSSWNMISFILTLLVLAGFVLGEKNFLFRLVTYSLVGLTSGLVLMIVIFQVLIPRMVWPLNSGNSTEAGLIIVPIILSLLLFTKLSQRAGRLGNVSMALMTGVGAAVLIGGALAGTIFPQIKAVLANFDPVRNVSNGLPVQANLLDAIFILFGTIASLAYFHFGGRRKQDQPAERTPLVKFLAWFGKIFIAVALGALFAGVFIAALTALVERLGFLWSVLRSLQL
ncbi:MAG: hypothetical protein AB9891_09685 [Anaerolineaceae bacterium]